jgi:hypothetical protein
VYESGEAGFLLKELQAALRHYGYSYHYKYVELRVKPLMYQQGAIVFIKRSARYPQGHYLVRNGEFWGDPWINLLGDKSLANAQAGFRKRLPGMAQYALLPVME